MRNLCFLFGLLLSACSTPEAYNQECFKKYAVFDQAVDCTKKNISADPLSQIILSNGHLDTISDQAELFDFMDVVVEGVGSGKYTNAQGKYLITQKINEFRRNSRKKSKLADLWEDDDGFENGDELEDAETFMDGDTLYDEDECVGTVFGGKCNGRVMEKAGYHKTCHGSSRDGECLGLMY